MSKIIVTITGAGTFDDEAVEIIKEDCEEIVCALGGHGVSVEVEVLP